MASTEKIEYLIVPCPGNPTFYEDEVRFSDLDGDLYLGAEDRMKAAIVVAETATNIVLVGGSQSKVVAMFIYFTKEIKRLGLKKPLLICLVSNRDSTGNLSAFKRYLKENKIDLGSSARVAIISNRYHLPRLKLVWDSLFPNTTLQDISAEKILKKGTKEVLYDKELKRREIIEEAGHRDWKNKCYRNQDKIEKWDEKFWKCEELTLNFETKEYT